MLAAIRRLPDRQREAVVLRFYLELPEDRGRGSHAGQPGHREVRDLPRRRRGRPDAQGRGGRVNETENRIRTATQAAARIVA